MSGRAVGSTDKCNPKIGRFGLTWIVPGEAKGLFFKFYREASNTVADWLNMARGSLPQHLEVLRDIQARARGRAAYCHTAQHKRRLLATGHHQVCSSL